MAGHQARSVGGFARSQDVEVQTAGGANPYASSLIICLDDSVLRQIGSRARMKFHGRCTASKFMQPPPECPPNCGVAI